MCLVGGYHLLTVRDGIGKREASPAPQPIHALLLERSHRQARVCRPVRYGTSHAADRTCRNSGRDHRIGAAAASSRPAGPGRRKAPR